MPIVDAPPETPLVIDTDIVSHLRNKREYVEKNIKTHFFNTKQFPAITAITVFEANQGIESELNKQKISVEQADVFRLHINTLIQNHRILPFDQKAAEIAAYIFARLSKSDRNKHWRDLFIVATAIAYNYGLATQNKRDMELLADHLPKNTYLRSAIWKS